MMNEKDMIKNMDEKMKAEMEKIMNNKMEGKKASSINMDKKQKEKGKK